jgi:hypothetical protein
MRRPSPALVISLIALFFSLAGTGWAVTQLPRNSVGTSQIKANAVTGPKVKDGSLSAADFAAGTLLAGAAGPAGPQGERGPQGVLGTASAVQKNNQSFMSSSVNVISTDPAAPTPVPCYSNCRGSTGAITVSQPSRIVISAQVSLRNAGGVADAASCTIFLGVPGPGLLDLTYGGSATEYLPAGETDTLGLTGAADVAAGTYDIVLRCGDAGGSTGTVYEADDIAVTAFAVAR